MSTPSRRGRRGRLPADERSAREDAVLDAALAELVEHGPDGLSMLGVARRAGASKATLYSWFGNRDGLLTAMIRRSADRTAVGVEHALRGDADPVDTLTTFAAGLLGMLTAPPSVALNRAAMTSPELAARLLESGRHRVGPLVERYLAELAGNGVIAVADTDDAFRLLYGLVIQDTQIRVLLGEPAPDPDAIRDRARRAVSRFFALVGPASESA